MSDSPRSRFHLPHWGWLLLATVVLVVGFAGLSVWLPHYREQQVMHRIKGWKGSVTVEKGGPEWLRKLVSEDRIKEFKVFDRAVKVVLEGTVITNTEVAQLSGLTNLKSLDL